MPWSRPDPRVELVFDIERTEEVLIERELAVRAPADEVGESQCAAAAPSARSGSRGMLRQAGQPEIGSTAPMGSDAGIGRRRRQPERSRVPGGDKRDVAWHQPCDPIDRELHDLTPVAQPGSNGFPDEVAKAAHIGMPLPLHPGPKIRRMGYGLQPPRVVS
jgi:hypothetical protein